jgi:hypothetical protein
MGCCGIWAEMVGRDSTHAKNLLLNGGDEGKSDERVVNA